ncbi:MAG: SPOR domain-containing protein, partial [Gemmatimonadota bacterium]|nr:SPOR domain-containing protein [Gemmatimonadota bacterium]
MKEKAVVTDTVSTAVSVLPRTIAQNQRPKPPTEGKDTKPSIVDPTKSPAKAGVKPPTKVTGATSRPSGYSVQVAAYNRKPEADKLASSLTKRGYQARVDGTVAPFRVRIGRYTTTKEAEDALRKIKANHMAG